MDWKRQVDVDYGEMSYSIEELYQAFKERLKKEGLLDTTKKGSPCEVRFG